jgi:hypothetical protein
MPPLPYEEEGDVKKLSCVEAQKAFIRFKSLSYEVTAKFDDDHITAPPVLSKSACFASAVERFKKQPNVLESSWILVDKSTLKNKVVNATKVACVYGGAQQMALAIKVQRRKVLISAHTRKEIQGHNPEHYKEVSVGGDKRYLELKSLKIEDITLCVTGPWNPFTGVVLLFHYAECAMPACAMLEKYLRWHVDKDGRTRHPEARK